MMRTRSFCENGCGHVATRVVRVEFEIGLPWFVRTCDRCCDDVAFLSLLEPGSTSAIAQPIGGDPPESARRQIAAVNR